MNSMTRTFKSDSIEPILSGWLDGMMSDIENFTREASAKGVLEIFEADLKGFHYTRQVLDDTGEWSVTNKRSLEWG
jgi:hypothetical protein